MNPTALQVIGLAGAFCCLIAYGGHQLKRLDTESITYNVLNALGAGMLFYVAFYPLQLGFIVMEGAWTLISLYALFKMLRRRTR